MSAITEFDGVVGEIKELVDGIYDFKRHYAVFFASANVTDSTTTSVV